MMRPAVILTVLIGVILATAVAAEMPSTSPLEELPSDARPISEYYYNGQIVYDRHGNEVGDVNDILVDSDGKIIAVMVGVGGFLGAGEKSVAVPFRGLKVTEKDLDSFLVIDASRATLETAPGYTFDRAERSWVASIKRD